jgi:cobalt-zinc-cadmium resistance protein CzcA
MINKILWLSIERRGLMLSLILLIIGIGVWSYQKLPIDAVPDITNVQVQINTKAPGYSPLEVEQRITYPVERAIAGLPNLDYTRSISRYGLSQVTVVFEEGTDLYFARNLVNNRLAVIKGSLPEGMDPEMGPIATGLGEILMYTVTAEPDAKQADGTAYDATELRVIQDWVIKPRLERVSGVTEINTSGGYEKQFHVQPDPVKLLNFGISLSELKLALMRNNDNRGAGYIERNGEQILVRSPGQLKTIEDIRQVVVKNTDDHPILVKDLADVVIGKPLRSGAGTRDGLETVVGTVMMLVGENSRDVAATVARELKAIQASLPDGVIAEVVYD